MALGEAAQSKQSHINDALTRLHGRTDFLESHLDSLVSRLESVLTPLAPAPATSSGALSNACSPSSSVPHARTLHNIANQIDTQIERVRDLLERLAL